MPPALWDAAVSLARTHGVYAIARVLRVSYGTLKQRVEQRPAGDGASLVIRLRDDEHLDVVSLADAFWKRRV
jgi:hypothetical protein